MSSPRIAVLIPAYKAESVLARAIASLNLNEEPHDIIVVDDGSSVPVNTYLTPQANLQILRLAENGGVTRALNHGLSHILSRSYDFVARLDADDRAAPDRLERQRVFMDQHSDVALVGGWGRVVDEQGEALFYLNMATEHDQIVDKLFYNNIFLHPALFIRCATLRQLGGYEAKYSVASQDYELTRRIAAKSKVANLPHYLVDYTMSQRGISIAQRKKQLRARLKIQWAYRDLGSHHFYLGLTKTFALWFLPVKYITQIKQSLRAYRQKSPEADTAQPKNTA